jgi:hypothetical protein
MFSVRNMLTGCHGYSYKPCGGSAHHLFAVPVPDETIDVTPSTTLAPTSIHRYSVQKMEASFKRIIYVFFLGCKFFEILDLKSKKRFQKVYFKKT